MVDVDEVYHDDAPPSRDDTEGRVLQNELARQLSLAIGMLETDLAYIIHKHYIEGQTIKVIAKRLGRSESRISQLHRRALSELRATLSALGYGDVPAALAMPA
jgi:RNA polymerase sigma factor for flagellar operon FliA